MTRDVTPDLQRIRLFLTEPHDCSYLQDQKATTAFVDPQLKVTDRIYTQLSVMGFRRSGKYIYTPQCDNCSACIPVRIHSGGLKLNRQQKRCLKRNADLKMQVKHNVNFEEHFPLYEEYIATRHKDGDMFPPTLGQFQDFIGELWPNSRILEFRSDNKLIAASVIDILHNGLSAIYTYFSIQETRRSPGTYAILSIAELAATMNLPYVYLGYWIRDCRKMTYKSSFRPIEMLINGEWLLSDE